MGVVRNNGGFDKLLKVQSDFIFQQKKNELTDIFLIQKRLY